MVLIAFLHAFEHSVALRIRAVERSTGEISGEEIREAWDLGSGSSSGSNTHHVGPGGGSWWDEEGAVVEAESLHIWVLQETGAHGETTLEWMSSDHEWMCVIYIGQK